MPFMIITRNAPSNLILNSIRQVRSLLELFRPLCALPTAPTHPALNKPMNNVNHQISWPPLSEDAFLSRISPNQTPRLLNYKHVNELGKPTSCVYPVHYAVPYSAAAQPVPSQAPRTQFYSPASTITLEGTYAPAMGSGHTQPPPDPQYSHQTILNPQPEFHSSLVNMGSGHAQTLQDSQYGYHNIVHPQPEFHSSLTTTGNSHTQPPPDPQYSHQTIINPQPEFHSFLVNMGSVHAQTLQDSQHAYHNIIHPQPEFHSSVMTMGSIHIQSLQGPQYQSISNPSDDFHSSVENAGSSHPQCPGVLTIHTRISLTFNLTLTPPWQMQEAVMVKYCQIFNTLIRMLKIPNLISILPWQIRVMPMLQCNLMLCYHHIIHTFLKKLDLQHVHQNGLEPYKV